MSALLPVIAREGARRCLGTSWHPHPLAVCCLHTAVRRDPWFSQLKPDDISFFNSVLGDHAVTTDVAGLEPHNRDWMGKYQGQSCCVVKPTSTDQVQRIVQYCFERRLALVPQGGNTGLVGGSVPVFDEIILNTSRMNRILSFDPTSGVLVAQAGCVLGALESHIWPEGWTMPLDLGAKGSCQIGGNISTNAGGLRLLRYGSLHGTVLGLEVVTGDGKVLDLVRTLRKDNTGYDLKQLFIGAEGTLGVVTQVAIQCAPRPAAMHVVFLALDSFQSVTRVLSAARQQLGEVLSAFEFMDSESMAAVTQYLPGVVNPLPPPGSAAPAAPGSGSAGEVRAGDRFYVLIETHGSNSEHDEAKLNTFLEDIMANPELGVQDGVMAENESQAAAIWRVREGIAEALGRRGAVFKYDVSLPVHGMYGLVDGVRHTLRRAAGSSGGGANGGDVRVVGYGHVGDGNLHLNISAPKYSPELQAALEPYVYEQVAAQQGSISAEHGLGQQKAECIGYSKPPAAVHLMAGIKHLLDPRGILNPYKVLPHGAISGQGSSGSS